MRDQTVLMVRVRNEERWIGRVLERALQVCRYAVIWDDGSTDRTQEECMKAVMPGRREGRGFGWVAQSLLPQGPTELHYLPSPFAARCIHPELRVNEWRDKVVLWEYVKTCIPFQSCLCLDGDEVLTLEAIRYWGEAIRALERHDIVCLPFSYLWNGENTRRVDGLYGDAPDGMPQIRHARLFSVARVSHDMLSRMTFRNSGSRAGFHIGSVPQKGFRPGALKSITLPLQVAHLGYIDDEIRQRKYAWYNELDPNNEGEGCYAHVIGEPNRVAPGPVKLAEWVDA